MKAFQLKKSIADGKLCAVFSNLYGAENIERAKERYNNAIDAYTALFGSEDDLALFSAPGRTEIGGNHTDHNRGRVLAGSVDLDVIAVAAKTQDGLVSIHSKGFSPDVVDLSDLTVHEDEKGKSASLIRGVAKGFADRGLCPSSFRAYTTSNVPKGSGVSSSAAFEVLLATIFDHFFFGGKLAPMEIAKIAQFAEREYFGKPCGLMDQAACALGGVAMIDFADTLNPVVEQIPFSLASAGLKLCLVNVGGDHASLTHLYAAIPDAMTKVASFFGKETLHSVSEDLLMSRLAEVRNTLGDNAALMALHFVWETARVLEQKAALAAGDTERFLALVRESGHSSFEALQNVLIPGQDAEQGAAIALNLAARLLRGGGAWRIHGGGFGGTIQSFVPEKDVPAFKATMDAVFGKDACVVLSIRPVGPIRLI